MQGKLAEQAGEQISSDPVMPGAGAGHGVHLAVKVFVLDLARLLEAKYSSTVNKRDLS